MTSLGAKWARARRAGLRATLRCRFDRLGLHALRLIFRFDSWHAGAPFSCRPYKAVVVGLANALQPRTVVEVGCGLGDIVSRVAAIERIGIDTDPGVIRAARFLHSGRGRWIHGDEYSIQKIVAPEHTIDCLIMVNWIHAISPERLLDLLLPVLPRTRYLILDAIDDDGPSSYRFKHNFDFLSTLARRVSIARTPGEPRQFIVFEVTKQ